MKNHYEIRDDLTAIFLKRRNGEILETVIDTADLAKVREFKGSWYASWNSHTNSFYVLGNLTVGFKKQISVRLHRFLMNAPYDCVVDHINGNPLDNRRTNLRVCSNDENMRNRRKLSRCRSRHKGVTFDDSKVACKWRARISVDGKRICIGYFATEEEAAIAYNDAAVKYHKEFAKLNAV